MSIRIHTLIFNDFGVNTYILEAENQDCIIVDAACHSTKEQAALSEIVASRKINPIFHISTHTHIDHVLGSAFVKNNFGTTWLIHADGTELLNQAPMFAGVFGLKLDEFQLPDRFVVDAEEIMLGNNTLKILYTPGHAHGSICIYCEAESFVITGDVLFCGSIGRTDLPGGDTETLLNSIAEKLLVLPNETKVYPGHGTTTTIGEEKRENPYLQIN
jgi:glyoxylase-like metal-dependent hydrolase (beta-lactamase superfamily II)